MSETRKTSRSPIWDYFEAISSKSTRCNLCQTVYRNSGNTTNLIDHLKRRHRAEHAKFVESTKGQPDLNLENAAELPLAIQNIKYEVDNQEILALPGDGNIELIHAEDEIAMEEQENANSIEEGQIVDVLLRGNEDGEKNADFNEQDDPQIVKIIPLPHARSEVWHYFGFIANNEGQIIDKSKVVCKMCASTFCYSGNTTNFYSHLKSMHSEIQLRSVPSKNVRSMKRSYTSMNHDDSHDNDYLNESRSNNIHESLLDDDSIPSRSRQDLVYVEDITNAIVDFVVTDCRPISVIQGKGFQRLLRLLAPGYSLPDKQKLAVAVRKRYDEMRKETEHGALQ